jgi:hypothetical protein
VPVLEHEQRRPVACDACEQVGDGGVETVTLGVRIGRDGRRQVADARGQVGQKTRQFPAAAAERRAQCRRVGGARQVVERLDERPVRRADDGVARAIENERAVARHLRGELPDEPALAGAGLTAKQDDAAALAFRPRHQRAQPLQLGGAADEREGRGGSKRAGKVGHVSGRDDSQI